MNYWLMKTEPDVFSWDDLVTKGPSAWDGVRNYAARNNLRAMKKGDKVLIYHSNIGKEVVGISVVTKEHFPDPTTTDERWLAVQVKAEKKFKKTVELSTIKSTPSLQKMMIVTHSRLSVMPVSAEHYHLLCEMGGL
ncbi:MAG: EVE domain-containing protein [Bacteroidota bacterium]